MSRIILSCGHEVYDLEHAYTIMTKSTNRYGDPAVKYQTTCGPCEDRYRQQGQIFDTEQEAFESIQRAEANYDILDKIVGEGKRGQV